MKAGKAKCVQNGNWLQIFTLLEKSNQMLQLRSQQSQPKSLLLSFPAERRFSVQVLIPAVALALPHPLFWHAFNIVNQLNPI